MNVALHEQRLGSEDDERLRMTLCFCYFERKSYENGRFKGSDKLRDEAGSAELAVPVGIGGRVRLRVGVSGALGRAYCWV